MRGEDRVRVLAQGGGHLGFVFEHVERGRAETAVLERRDHRVGVDEPAAADVHQQAAGRHLRELRGADQMPGLPGQRCVQNDDVAADQQLVEADGLESGGLRAEHRVADQDSRTERGQLAHRGPADPAVADDAAGQFGEPAQSRARGIPAGRTHFAVERNQAPGPGEHHADGVVGDLFYAVVRDVRHPDAALGRLGHGDVVEPDAEPGHDAQVFGRAD